MLNFTNNSENEDIQTEIAKDVKIIVNHDTETITLEFNSYRDKIVYFVDNYDIKEILEKNGLSFKKYKKLLEDEEWFEIEEYLRVIVNENIKFEKEFNNMLLNFWEVCDKTKQMFPDYYTLNYTGSPEDILIELTGFYEVLAWTSRQDLKQIYDI